MTSVWVSFVVRERVLTLTELDGLIVIVRNGRMATGSLGIGWPLMGKCVGGCISYFIA